MTQKTPRVFVTQEVRTGRIDYSPARAWGQIKFCTIMDFSPEEESQLNEVLVQDLRRVLADYDPQVDWVVMSGSPLVIAAIFMIIRERTASARVLRWSNRDHVYQEVTINLL
ncbi:MAG: hypothetical protein E6R08_06515 [Nevskiaceae bacterium]|nr:MAG: hypothetical protein E6R08_06515 [Nevskiaceae bacterium]